MGTNTPSTVGEDTMDDLITALESTSTDSPCKQGGYHTNMKANNTTPMETENTSTGGASDVVSLSS